MSRRRITNVAASVHQRLLDKAKGSGRPFNELLQYYAMERLLYRLSVSSHAGRFVLKGALMFTAWRAPFSRPTMDIDLLGNVDNDVGVIADMVRDVCLQAVEPDGLLFDPSGVKGESVTEGAEYTGVRIRFRGNLGKARIAMQVDIGFGDVVVPPAGSLEYPTILDMPAPRLRGYSRESSIAEKFQAMVKLGALNSRMKDFFDVWLLSTQFDFDGGALGAAIAQTFSNRKTEVPPGPPALTRSLAQEPTKQKQWQGFLRKSRIENAPGDFRDVIDAIAAFLEPVVGALAAGRPSPGAWTPSGHWAE